MDQGAVRRFVFLIPFFVGQPEQPVAADPGRDPARYCASKIIVLVVSIQFESAGQSIMGRDGVGGWLKQGSDE